MNKGKTILVIAGILILTSSGLAIEYNPLQDQPVNKTYNSTIQSVEFNQQYFNSTVNTNILQITGENIIPSNTYTVNVDLVGNNTDQLTINIPEYNNYQLKPSQINDTLSIGSSGQLQTINIHGNGNTVTESQLNLTGNITEFTTLLDTDKFIPTNNERPVNLVYDIPRNQEFGDYTGKLHVKTENHERNISINLVLKDKISPEIVQGNVNSLMATNTEKFSFNVKDNLNVKNGEISVYREEERIVNASTGEKAKVNVSIINSDLNQNPDNDAVWTYQFNKSSIQGDYFAKVSFTDESNNTVIEKYSFSVNGLDSINVLNNDFRFKDSRPRDEDNPSRVVEKQVFSKESDKQLNLSIAEDFTVSGNNTVTVGIREEDSENPSTLYRNGSSKGVTSLNNPGTYVLTVYSSDSGFSYSGALSLEPVPQHVRIDRSIEFSGSFVDPEYPELPENRSLGSFTGSLDFISNENGVPTGLVFKGEQLDISDCKGVDSWSDCIPGYSLGEIPEVKQENRVMSERINALFTGKNGLIPVGFKWQRNFMILFLIGFVASSWAKGTRETERKVSKEKIGTIWENKESVKV